jgi:hypothetical protein
MNWKPIDTAPKDARPVWVRGHDYGDSERDLHYGWAHFHPKKERWLWADSTPVEALYIAEWLDQSAEEVPASATTSPQEKTVIDWSKVHPNVPVKMWDVPDRTCSIFEEVRYTPKIPYPFMLDGASSWKYASLVTGKWVAWFGGECPVPEGVIVKVVQRDGYVSSPANVEEWEWQHRGTGSDIIAFHVTGLADGYTWGGEE